MSDAKEPCEAMESEKDGVPYEKPSIAWEERIEDEARLMSACGKVELGPCDAGNLEFS
jgi:hypothetical protein